MSLSGFIAIHIVNNWMRAVDVFQFFQSIPNDFDRCIADSVELL